MSSCWLPRGRKTGEREQRGQHLALWKTPCYFSSISLCGAPPPDQIFPHVCLISWTRLHVAALVTLWRLTCGLFNVSTEAYATAVNVCLIQSLETLPYEWSTAFWMTLQYSSSGMLQMLSAFSLCHTISFLAVPMTTWKMHRFRVV